MQRHDYMHALRRQHLFPSVFREGSIHYIAPAELSHARTFFTKDGRPVGTVVFRHHARRAPAACHGSPSSLPGFLPERPGELMMEAYRSVHQDILARLYGRADLRCSAMWHRRKPMAGYSSRSVDDH